MKVALTAVVAFATAIAATAQFIRDEIAKYAQVIKAAGIKPL